jgi:hypothetical protein
MLVRKEQKMYVNTLGIRNAIDRNHVAQIKRYVKAYKIRMPVGFDRGKLDDPLQFGVGGLFR